MIQYYKKQGKRLITLEQREENCWINIAAPFSQEELEELSNSLDIPLDFLTDSLDIDERSRYEIEDEVRLIVINTPILNRLRDDYSARYITVPIGIIITPHHLLTITSFENPILNRFLDNKIKNFDPTDRSRFILQLMEQNVHQFLVSLKALNAKRNLLEKELYNSSRNEELRQLLNIEKSLVYFVTSLSANDLLAQKMKRIDLLGIRHDEYKFDLLEDLIIDNTQALEMANIYTNILAGTMDAFASIISNNLNIVMKRLTSITIILMIPTLVASFFGMNVPNGMESHPFAMSILFIASLLCSLLLVWFMHRRRMF